MKLGFAKMTGAGNDFIVIDDRGNAIGEDARELCRRRVSVGADGLILLVPSTRCDFRMRYFNADGSEADMCGNGGRCVARFAHDLGIVGREMQFETRSGLHRAVITDDGVCLSMTEPRAMLLNFAVFLYGQKFVVHRINTGVPHAVMEVDDIEAYPVVDTGRALRHHDIFLPEGTNVDFVHVLDENRIALRTYERGVEDETLACGTGAVASAVVMAALKRVRPPVSVRTHGGDTLVVGFYMSDQGFCDVTLAGDAKVVYNGAIERSED
jgi:diaminopimelate epimerase